MFWGGDRPSEVEGCPPPPINPSENPEVDGLPADPSQLRGWTPSPPPGGGALRP